MSPVPSASAATQALAAAIRDAREHVGLTPTALATRAGIDPSAYHAIELGERQPDLDAIVQIASALDVSATELLARAKL
ncbi:MAG TPA: helix-turn-helix transcriptional regulator [Solirubrobacteraceae bacterium]|jgi:transcriptional regulator with XRE-family HTH domain|nr:helix-turn-helix transcriptional regulator [Solirubrobacteraceae bacterium]